MRFQALFSYADCTREPAMGFLAFNSHADFTGESAIGLLAILAICSHAD